MHESVAKSQAAALPIGSPMCWMFPAMASSSGRQAARARASPEMKSGVSGRPICPGVASRAPSRYATPLSAAQSSRASCGVPVLSCTSTLPRSAS
ncbi:hypothetical protein D9M72_493930 [compost metagenome]